jgi:hypothetical protein
VSEERCSHPERVDGVCRECGDCAHEVVLNGACFYCGAEDVQVTVKPVAESAFVPTSRLRKPR